MRSGFAAEFLDDLVLDAVNKQCSGTAAAYQSLQMLPLALTPIPLQFSKGEASLLLCGVVEEFEGKAGLGR
jgi:hypothetical protein